MIYCHVFYSTIFTPFREEVEKLKIHTPALSEFFRTNYEIWIAYHAILQVNSKIEAREDVDEDVLERLLEDDRIRVARMQVKQAYKTAELMRSAIIEQAAE